MNNKITYKTRSLDERPISARFVRPYGSVTVARNGVKGVEYDDSLKLYRYREKWVICLNDKSYSFVFSYSAHDTQRWETSVHWPDVANAACSDALLVEEYYSMGQLEYLASETGVTQRQIDKIARFTYSMSDLIWEISNCQEDPLCLTKLAGLRNIAPIVSSHSPLGLAAMLVAEGGEISDDDILYLRTALKRYPLSKLVNSPKEAEMVFPIVLAAGELLLPENKLVKVKNHLIKMIEGGES